MRFRKYTKEQLYEAVKTSKSIRQVLILLNVAPHGGNYKVIKDYIKKLNIDITHFTGSAHARGKKIGPKRNIEVYLVQYPQYKIASHSLKKRLIQENYFEHKCYKCNLTTWNNQPIPIELEHIDGNHYNNQITNLTLLCPNCHAQTPTYRGKNISK